MDSGEVPAVSVSEDIVFEREQQQLYHQLFGPLTVRQRSPQCGASSRDLLEEKSKSPLFQRVGQVVLWLQMTCALYDVVIRFMYEPPHDKTNKVACAPSEVRSAWASAQSDQSSLCALWVA